MRNIKELVPKPSDAIRAMIEGLEDVLAGKYANFHIDMGTYGTKSGNVCYGCAATSACMKLTGVLEPFNYLHENSNEYDEKVSAYYGFRGIDQFEEAVDSLRRATNFICFMKYYSDPETMQFNHKLYQLLIHDMYLLPMNTGNVAEALPYYKKLLERLLQIDL